MRNDIMINIENLREDLISYFGTAIYYNPMAIMELEKVKKANDEELIRIAERNNFNIERYKIKER